MNTTQPLTPGEMSDRQFLGWNVQVRQQLVEDLYYTCRQNGEILEEILDDYIWLYKEDEDKLNLLQSYCDEELE